MPEITSSRHYAIYGGSFDPIHIGHIALAEHAVRECGIDRLIFMPAYVSPFKQNRKVAPGHDRAAMIESVLDVNKAFCLSRYELSKEGPSYTYETVMHWKKLLGGKLSFILGFDSVIEIDTWYHGEDLLREVSLITARRPYANDMDGFDKIQYYRDKFGTEITILDMKPVDASSTEIRMNRAAGYPITGMVHPEVEKYIIEHDLYKD
jgi:nicotinate-nucleotide adenylyltransferase